MIQSFKSKKGEVNYRSKLSLQYLNKKTIFSNEPDQKQIIRKVKERVAKTKKDFINLKKEGVLFTPYLEIGAEFTHRSMVLADNYKAHGFALDISLESLSLANFFKKNLKVKKLPQRICADAYLLPFQDNSFNFVFCYQTLHHFPNPKKVIEEIYRVLKPQGVFYADEEPVSQTFNLNLWRRPTNLRPWEKFLKGIFILPFLSQIGKTETDYGILENSFNLQTWEETLLLFQEATVQVETNPFPGRSELQKNSKLGWLKPSLRTRLLLNIIGGGIRILAKKNGSISKSSKNGPLLVCPDCRIPLKNNLSCPKCHFIFPVVSRIKVLLKKNLIEKLYPQINDFRHTA